MTNPRKILKALGLARLMQPCRGIVTWACQRWAAPSDWVAKYVPWSWMSKPFTIHGNGWKCRWFPTEFDAIGHRLFLTGLRVWEKETSPIMLEQIRRSHCFIDVGANCGVYTVLGCTVNPSIQVVAVEPAPRVCAALENNVRQNGYDSRVTVLNIAPWRHQWNGPLPRSGRGDYGEPRGGRLQRPEWQSHTGQVQDS